MFNFTKEILSAIEWFVNYIQGIWQDYSWWEFTVSCIAAFVYIVLYPLGGLDIQIGTLIIIEFFDWITGMWKSHVKGGWSSAKGREGMKKVIGFMMVIIMANMIDHMCHSQDLLINWRFIVISFYVSIEGKSVLENLKALGIKSPSTFWKAFRALKDLVKKGGGKNGL